jgi:hypothetical protein
MLEHTLVTNLDACRLEAEISAQTGTVIAILFEDNSGWHLEVVADAPAPIPAGFIEEVKVHMRQYVNRTGGCPPEEMTRGELSLWLMLKDDGTAMGMPYAL